MLLTNRLDTVKVGRERMAGPRSRASPWDAPTESGSLASRRKELKGEPQWSEGRFVRDAHAIDSAGCLRRPERGQEAWGCLV